MENPFEKGTLVRHSLHPLLLGLLIQLYHRFTSKLHSLFCHPPLEYKLKGIQCIWPSMSIFYHLFQAFVFYKSQEINDTRPRSDLLQPL